MRIAYACYASAFADNGVNDKIATQLRWWRRERHNVELFCLSRAPDSAGATPVVPGRIFLFSNAMTRMRATVALARAIRRTRPDVIYLRYDVFCPPLVPLLGRAPVVVEVNTNDRSEHRLQGRFGWLYNELTRGLSLRAAAGVVYVAHELAESSDFTRFGRPSIVIGNGSDPDRLNELPTVRNDRPVAAVLIGELGPWHGLDKVVTLARALPEIDVHLVGAGLAEAVEDPPDNIWLHGEMTRSQYREVLARADFGIAVLALHRKGMAEASPLKVREYLLHGLPVLSGHLDTDFMDGDPWYLLRLPNCEENVTSNGAAIRQWVASVRGRRVPREAVVARLGSQGKETARLAFMSAAAGGGTP